MAYARFRALDLWASKHGVSLGGVGWRPVIRVRTFRSFG